MADDNMTNDIVNDIAHLTERVEGLESNESNALSISRIFKVYGNISIRATLSVSRRTSLFPGSGVFPSGGLFVGGNTILTRDTGV